MDWHARFLSVLDHLEQVPVPKWLSLLAAVMSIVLLIALIATSLGNLRLRQRLAARDGGEIQPLMAAGWEDDLPAISLEGEGRALIDRVLPQRPRNFLIVVAVLSVGCWLLGLALTTDPRGFLVSREWQLQPIYLAAHFVTLRLFATMLTRNFLAGAMHLEMPTRVHGAAYGSCWARGRPYRGRAGCPVLLLRLLRQKRWASGSRQISCWSACGSSSGS